jgi:hypothetical protein
VTVPPHYPPDTPESSDLPERDRTRGPLALILSSLRSPTQTALDEINALANTGSLTDAQARHLSAAVTAIGQVLRTVERYAPLEVAAASRPPAPKRPRNDESWSAGEQPDALDDRYQDSSHPFSDDPDRDTEV